MYVVCLQCVYLFVVLLSLTFLLFGFLFVFVLPVYAHILILTFTSGSQSEFVAGLFVKCCKRGSTCTFGVSRTSC